MLKRLLPLFLAALPLLSTTGCDSNPTNAPTKAEADAADQKRAAAVDNDPSLTAEQKASMKAHMGLGAAAAPKR